MSTKVLTRRQARWAEFLGEFNFVIIYRSGKLNSLPDALTRWDGVYPSEGEAFADKNPGNIKQMFKVNADNTLSLASIAINQHSDLIQLISKSHNNYPQL